MRHLTAVLTTMIAILMLAVPLYAAPAETYPDIIPLPDGWRPEGITSGAGHVAYVGSLGTGAIYRADLLTGEGEIAVPPQSDRIAVGLAFDQRSNHIFAAGGPGGAAYVYNASTGESVGLFQFSAGGSFINDVVVTKDAAYFTDSFQPFLYKVSLGAAGDLPGAGVFETLSITGDFVYGAGFNANGIVATPDGKSLIVVGSIQGALYHVDPQSGLSTQIDLDGAAVPSGDGLLLIGKKLYVMQNQLNQIAVVELAADLSAGEVVGTITNPDFDVPTTITGFGNAVYAVNARFGTPDTPTTGYDIVRVER